MDAWAHGTGADDEVQTQVFDLAAEVSPSGGPLDDGSRSALLFAIDALDHAIGRADDPRVRLGEYDPILAGIMAALDAAHDLIALDGQISPFVAEPVSLRAAG